MKKFLVCLAMSIVFITTGKAQEETLNDTTYKKEHLVGVHTGSTTGLGFSYKYVPNKWGFQVTGIPIFAEDFSFISAGTAITYRPFKKPTNNDPLQFLLYTGIHAIAFDYELDFLAGSFGLGWERLIGTNLTFNFMLGYGVYSPELDSPISMVAGEIGLHYKIN